MKEGGIPPTIPAVCLLPLRESWSLPVSKMPHKKEKGGGRASLLLTVPPLCSSLWYEQRGRG